MFCQHVFGNISCGFRGISRFLGNFAGFRGNAWISRVRDRAKYQKPCNMHVTVKSPASCCHLYITFNCYFIITYNRQRSKYRFIIYSTMWIAAVNDYNFLVYVWLFCPFFLQLLVLYQVLLTVIWPTVDLRHFTSEWGNIKLMLLLLQDSWRKTPE